MLKEKRLEKGITQQDLAENVGISKGYLSRLESGGFRNTTVQVILKLSAELSICPVELFLYFAEIKCYTFREEG